MSTIKRQGRFTIVPAALVDSDLSDRAVRLRARLDGLAVHDSEVAVTRERLAEDLNTTPANIDRALRELADAGWLEIVTTKPGKPSSYVLLDGTVSE